MKQFIACVILIAAMQYASAQVSYPISTYAPTPKAFRNLLLTNQQIEYNDTINEEIIDLVNPVVLDSILDRKKEHHELFLLGWFIHAFGGYDWREVKMVKQKFVGTAHDDGRSSEDEFTEYDINFTLHFHLNKYLYQSFDAYDQQAHIHRQDIRSKLYPRRHKPRNYAVPPFVRDTNNLNANMYGVHCEVTPPIAFRSMINYLFYPVFPGINIDRHPNFMGTHPSMGFYGASCLDCNHSCHPEIHPYEWLWWMNLHSGSPKDKVFLLGMLKDASNRFHQWSHNPKTGKATVPFAFEVKDTAATGRIITIEHLVFGKFIDSNLTKMGLPANTFNTDQRSVQVTLADGKGVNIPITVMFPNQMIGAGVRYWVTDVNWDAQNHILSGLLNLATSVQDLYMTRVTVACP
jgi:hypothetical protein